MKITPLDSWVNNISGGDLPKYQLEMLKETLARAQNSPYYKNTLPPSIKSLSDIVKLPLMDSETLKRHKTELVCVSQREISRIVTLSTSGSTGNPKRVFFTESDQELTVDYFAHGLAEVVNPGGVMAVLLPCESPGGVGDLIARALARIPAKAVRHGFVKELASCAKTVEELYADALVGVPIQILALARYCRAKGIKPGINSVLLSTDFIPRTIINEIKTIWNCEVYEHYGMTEMGLGGAIDCGAHDGYHIRENDLLFEILDRGGNPLPENTYGEIAFSTLTRRGMPFVRYRTGDISKLISGICSCGSALKRIAPVKGRIGGSVVMECGTVLRLGDFDEVLFQIPEVCDFDMTAQPRENLLKITVYSQKSIGTINPEELNAVLSANGLARGLKTELYIKCLPDIIRSGNAKRTIRVIV